MAGFPGVNKHGGCARRRQSGGYFGANVSAFAHACYHHSAFDIQHHLDGLRKARVQSGFDAHQGFGFNVQSLASELEGLIGVEGHVFILTRDGAKRDYDDRVAANSTRESKQCAKLGPKCLCQ